MAKRKLHACSKCQKVLEKCRQLGVDEHGAIVWVCAQCLAKKGEASINFNYDPPGYGHGV